MLWPCSTSGSCLGLGGEWELESISLEARHCQTHQPDSTACTGNLVWHQKCGLGKGGTQGLNGCGVKVFRMDKIRPEVVAHLLLLLRDGYWVTVAGKSEMEFRKCAFLSGCCGPGKTWPAGRVPSGGDLCHGVDWQGSKSWPICPSDTGARHPKDPQGQDEDVTPHKCPGDSAWGWWLAWRPWGHNTCFGWWKTPGCAGRAEQCST